MYALETYKSNFRSAYLKLEGVQVAIVGLLNYFQWPKYTNITNYNNKQQKTKKQKLRIMLILTKERYGPYAVTVADGVLNFDMIRISGDPFLSSIEIWSVTSSTPSPTPPPTHAASGMEEETIVHEHT